MKQLILLIIGLWLTLSSYSQAFIAYLPKDKDPKELTLYDYRQAFDAYWAPYQVDKQGYYLGEDGKKHKAAYWKQFNRWYHFWEPRVDKKTGAFPPKAAGEIVSSIANQNQGNQGFFSGPMGSASWTSLGPNSSGGGYSGTGRLNCVAFHPSDNNTYWAGSPSGGLWLTTNNGSSWTALTDNNSVLGVSDIAIPSDYSTSNTIYIATGDRDGGSMWTLGGGQSNDNNTIGVLKSTNGGSSWSTTGLSYSTSQKKILAKLLIHPSNNNILFACGSDGIMKSSDGGSNWTNVYSSATVMDIEFKPSDPGVMYAATMSYSGSPQILKSTNSGASWSSAYSFSSSEYRVELAVTAANSAYVYAIAATTAGGLKGIYRSTNSGGSFSQMYDGTSTNHNLLGWYTDGSGGSDGQGSYDLSMAVSPSNSNEVYIGGVITHKSTNGGSSWTAVNCWTSSSTYNKNGAPVVHADHHMLRFRSSDNSLFEVCDGGLYYTTNGGSSWSHKTGNMVISQMYRISVSQSTAGELIAGLQDNGTKLRSGGSWSDVKGGDGMDCQISPSDVNDQYGSYSYGQITRTTNHWSSTTDIEPSSAGNGWWITPYLVDPNNNNTLYAGYADVWKTTNQGNSWTKISTMNTTNAYGTGDIRALAVAPSNSNVIYAADPDHLWVTNNGGSSWSDITSGLPVSSNSITYICVKDNDPNTLWVTFGGYNSSKVYQSTNGGSSWADISSGLPAIPVMCLVQNKLNTSQNELYAGTDVGVYIKTGSGAWTAYNTGLPHVVVADLDIYYDNSTPSNSRLYAGTFGRGAWSSPLNYTGCTPPSTQASSFGSSNLSSNSMDISWTRGNGNQVLVLARENAAVNADPASGSSYTANAAFGSGSQIGTGNYVVYDGTGSSVSVSNLSSGKTYHYAVYEYHTADNCYLTPALTGSATTLGPPSVSTTAPTNISANSATGGGNVSSTNGASLTHKGVCWSTAQNPTTSNNHTDDIAQGSGTGSFTSNITGLSALTTYYLRAYATNAYGTAYGNEESFTTACGTITSFPFSQNFDSWTNSSPAYSCTADGSVTLSDCWTNVAGDDIDWDILSGATASSNTGPSSGHGGSGNYLYTEASSCNSKTGYITSPNLDLTQVNNPELSFYYHMYGASMGTLSVQISLDGGSTWSADLWTLTGDQGNSWQQATISLAAYSSSSNAILRFKALTGSSYTSDMAIDDISIVAGPTCPAPSAQSESNITTSSADLNWSENGLATTWDIEYGPAGFTQGSGTTVSVTSNPYTLSAISGSTSYDWYVRANCGNGDLSSWEGPSTFTTSCGTVSAFPYVESFEGSTCWGQSDVTGTDGEWAIAGGTQHPSGTAAYLGSNLIFFNSYTAAAGQQTRLVSPDIDISSLNKAKVSFWLYHETGYSSSDDRIQAQVYSSSSWTDIGSSVSRYNGTTGWAKYTFDYSAYSGTVNVGLLATSDYGNDIHLDLIKIFDGEEKTDGNLSKCSPIFTRNGGSGDYFYDRYSFTVDESDNYDILADWTVSGSPFDGYLYLYEGSFDPDNPSANLLAYNNDFNSTSYSKISNQTLTAGTTYVVVISSYTAGIAGGAARVSISGNGPINAGSTMDFNGSPDKAYHNPVSTNGTTYTADYACDDSNGWTHYYDDNGSPSDYSDDGILLSVKKNGNNIGSLTTGLTVTVSGLSGAAHINNPPASYVSSQGGWFTFNRYWNLNPITQPGTPVEIINYFTDNDFLAVQNAINDNGGSPPNDKINMSFYKINSINSSYDPNPANGHSGIPRASSYDADGCWIYTYASTADAAHWTLINQGNGYGAQMTLAHFSGGGGGAANQTGNGDGSPLPVELLSLTGNAYPAYNLIHWTTATEINTREFIVERSPNAQNEIVTVGKTRAAGNSNSLLSYDLKDQKPLTTAYYRLVSIDYNGVRVASKWILIRRKAQNYSLVSLYPNPATQTAFVEILSPEKSTAILEVHDLSGRVLARKKLSLEAGTQSHQINLSTLNAGSYQLSLKVKGLIINKSLIKL